MPHAKYHGNRALPSDAKAQEAGHAVRLPYNTIPMVSNVAAIATRGKNAPPGWSDVEYICAAEPSAWRYANPRTRVKVLRRHIMPLCHR
jgi:hypothetical protein